jgi:hypothetical protein
VQALLGRLHESSQALEEEYLWLELTGVEGNKEELQLTLQLNEGYNDSSSVDDADVREVWKVTASRVIQHSVQLGVCEVKFYTNSNHPQLKSLVSEWQDLYYASPPKDIGELYYEVSKIQSKYPFWPFGIHGNPSFGCGLLSSGPKEVVEIYCEIAERLQMRPSILKGRNPLWPYSTEKLEGFQLLNLSGEEGFKMDCFVIAQSISAVRIS